MMLYVLLLLAVAASLPTTAAHPPPKQCLDLDPLCAAKKPLCASHKDFARMALLCPVTCGFCEVCATTTTAVMPTTEAPCEDLLQSCPMFKSKCATDTTVRMQCPKMCGICGGSTTMAPAECYDSGVTCCAIEDYCSDQSLRIDLILLCTLTCKLCNEVPTDTIPTATAGPGMCEDTSAGCAREAHLGNCFGKNTAPLMQRMCAKTCGYCTGEEGEEQDATDPPCVDLETDCEQKKDKCNDPVDTFNMTIRCPLTCGQCNANSVWRK